MRELDIIKDFEQKKVLLIGDTILDVYSTGQEVCQSSDSRAAEIEEGQVALSFGGASGVANNILELGGQVIFFSIVGDDAAAQSYDSFVHPNLKKYFIVDTQRPTIVKKRFWINGQKIFQANRVNNQDISPEIEKNLIIKIEPILNQADLIVVLDARHGLMTEALIQQLIDLSKKYNKPMYVDSQISHKGGNHRLYQGADCLFLNEAEARTVYAGFDADNPEFSVKEIKARLELSNVVVKLGARGSAVFFNGQFIIHPAHQVQVVDPCGAGDAFLAAFSLGDRQKPADSIGIANTWAALSTTILGTSPANKQDLIKIYE
ncbi:MAG: hypothetical protein HYT21_03060 [Candidatus Nealsonbacteria bacterium]|nr:hypothetical protein [Candidatus Nealsonbacteria bacterium]